MEENAYQVFGLENGPGASDADIRKAYRKLALVKHPDKNRDNPNAAAEFADLQKAYAILTDADARKALDDLLKAKAHRAERQGFRDEKRQRMMDELERREKQVEKERSQEEIARAKLKVEIERLRKQAAEREAKLYAMQREAATATAAATAAARATAVAAGSDATPDLRDKLSRTLKVSWQKKAGDYSVTQLRASFAAHGVVEDVVLREGKKKKGSALVVMATQEGAASAAGSVCGDLDNPLLVVPFPKAPFAGDEPIQVPLPSSMGTASVPPAPVNGQQTLGGAATRVPPSGSSTLFSAAAAGGDPGASGLPSRPAAPLFAAGGAGHDAGRGGFGTRPPSSFSLFPGGTAAASPSSSSAGLPEQREGVSGCPPDVRQNGAAASAPCRPLFAGAAAVCVTNAPKSGASSLGGFGSYRPSAGQSTMALNRDMEESTLQRLRQAAERQRLIEELEREDGL